MNRRPWTLIVLLIQGRTADVMEPFFGRDCRYLFFNNMGVGDKTATTHLRQPDRDLHICRYGSPS